LPIWNKFLKNDMFVDDKPWLLRFFDQVRFYPVSESELDVLRDGFREGRCGVRIEEEVFDLGAYNAFLESIAPELEVFRAGQKVAFDAEVAHWATDTAADARVSVVTGTAVELIEVAELSGFVVSADITGNVWKLMADPGSRVNAGDPLLILEAMKMEFHVAAPHDGIVGTFHCKPGMMINAGDPLVSLE
jgi:urea carboxylase